MLLRLWSLIIQVKMAYKRRQGMIKSSTLSIFRPPSDEDENENDDEGDSFCSSTPVAQAIRASVAHHDSSSLSSYFPQPASLSTGGFWGVLASKAKAILEEDDQQFQSPTNQNQFYYNHNVVSTKMDNPILRKRLHALTSSLNHIDDTIGNALEEGRTIVENKTADIIEETRKLHITRKGINSNEQNRVSTINSQRQQSSTQTNHEDQLKASRDVAMATAAKAKLLLRELKSVKADVAFVKLRCSQLEEENKILRESCSKGDNPADDYVIRLQLETLLAEKGRLAHENSVYARENGFLREIVEYHQLNMQDVVYLDEGIEEVTQVSRMHSTSPPTPH